MDAGTQAAVASAVISAVAAAFAGWQAGIAKRQAHVAEDSAASAQRQAEAAEQQVLAEPAWAKKLSHEDRRGLTALFWSNVNPYGTFRLGMDKRLDLGPTVTVPGPRATVDAAERSPLDKR